MNPYASFLGDRDPIEVIRATICEIEKLIGTGDREALNLRPAPGKWSVREILAHLADCEIVFAWRLRQSVAEAHHVIQPFDQDLWATQDEAQDARVALNVFSAVRAWNLVWLGHRTAADLRKTLTHPERGEMTVRVILETMAGHDTNHLKQIQRILT